MKFLQHYQAAYQELSYNNVSQSEKRQKNKKNSNFLSKPLDKREVTCYNTRPQTQIANELLEKKC
jgi:hypothetical protein